MSLNVSNKSVNVLFAMLLLGGVLLGGCARLPYTTKVVHEDQRVSVVLQQEVEPARYTHPVQLTTEQVIAILRGFSLREQQRLPLRWYVEEVPPKPVFREDELQVLAPRLVEALQHVGPEERVYFDLFASGMNPSYRRNVSAGWVAVRESLFQLTIDYFHVQQPIRGSDAYDLYYATPWTPPKTYLLYFEPGRFYATDSKTDTRGVNFKEFLKVTPLREEAGPPGVSPQQ